MFDNILIAKVLLIQRLRKRLNRRPRATYIRPIFLNRNVQGDSVLVQELRSDEEYHFKYFRMDKENFDFILQKVSNKIQHVGTHVRPISAIERLGVTLRYLASGNSQISLALNYRISPSSVTKILKETMTAICEELQSEFLPEPNGTLWKKNEEGFAAKWNFPNVCGAIDGKHIRVKAPKTSGSQFFNYKNFFSIVLFAISNAEYRFSAVDIGSAGSESDGGILMRSSIGKTLASGNFNLPQEKPILRNGGPIPHVVLGDSGFPLKTYLMTPFGGDFLAKEFRIYNYRLSRARMVVENSFGILAARWRIFHTTIDADVETVRLITRTAVILHNFLMSMNDMNSMTADRDENGTIVPGNWREITQFDSGLSNIPSQGSNNYSSSAAQIRNSFKEYFMSEGVVSWQENQISR